MVTLVTTLTTTASGVSASDVTLFQIIPTGIAFVEIERANLNRTLPCTIEQIRLKCLIGLLKANETIVLRLIYEIRQAMVNTSTVSMQSGLNFGLTNNSSPKVFGKYSVKAVRSVYADVKGYSHSENYMQNTLIRRISGQQLDSAKISDMMNLSMNYYSVKKTSY